MLALLAFVLGSAFGSFLNVVMDRVPAGQSIIKPGSRCPACGTALRPLDLIPVASYLWLRGRCRYCKARIPLRLLLVELATGLAFLAVYLRFGVNPGLLMLASLAGALILLGVARIARRG
ncbi:MAG: prepilin peptidase [Chloroflexi bacterium]|nr:prepilin peptidase [Chloroflexota bacterium]